MNGYFRFDPVDAKYFIPATTSAESPQVEGSVDSSPNDAQRDMEAIIKSYGTKRPSIVVKRYGIK
jgi:hypothetical protein